MAFIMASEMFQIGACKRNKFGVKKQARKPQSYTSPKIVFPTIPTWPKTMRLMSKIGLGEAGKGEWWPRAQILSSHRWVIKYSPATKYNTTQIQCSWCDQILGRPNTGTGEFTSTVSRVGQAPSYMPDVLTFAWWATTSKHKKSFCKAEISVKSIHFQIKAIAEV